MYVISYIVPANLPVGVNECSVCAMVKRQIEFMLALDSYIVACSTSYTFGVISLFLVQFDQQHFVSRDRAPEKCRQCHEVAVRRSDQPR